MIASSAASCSPASDAATSIFVCRRGPAATDSPTKDAAMRSRVVAQERVAHSAQENAYTRLDGRLWMDRWIRF
jgi:hypothetical protein